MAAGYYSFDGVNSSIWILVSLKNDCKTEQFESQRVCHKLIQRRNQCVESKTNVKKELEPGFEFVLIGCKGFTCVSIITQVIYISKTFEKVLTEVGHWLGLDSVSWPDQHLSQHHQELGQFLHQLQIQ